MLQPAASRVEALTEKSQIINQHRPGEPSSPGRFFGISVVQRQEAVLVTSSRLGSPRRPDIPRQNQLRGRPSVIEGQFVRMHPMEKLGLGFFLGMAELSRAGLRLLGWASGPEQSGGLPVLTRLEEAMPALLVKPESHKAGDVLWEKEGRAGGQLRRYGGYSQATVGRGWPLGGTSLSILLRQAYRRWLNLMSSG